MQLSAIVERHKKLETIVKIEEFIHEVLQGPPEKAGRTRRAKHTGLVKPRQLLTWIIAAKILKALYTTKIGDEGLHSKSATSTLRQVYYELLPTGLIKTANDITKAVTALAKSIKVGRHDLMVIASGRARLMARLRDTLGGHRTLEVLVRDHQDILLQLAQRVVANYIVVIEKEGIYQRLVESNFATTFPSILVCLGGNPDLNVRMLLHYLHKLYPELPIVGLTDCNAGGAQIVATLQFGSSTANYECHNYPVPIEWLGLRWSQVLELDLAPQFRLDYNQWDQARLKGWSEKLRKFPVSAYEGWSEEKKARWIAAFNDLKTAEKRVELQALYSLPGAQGFEDWLMRAIVRRDWI